MKLRLFALRDLSTGKLIPNNFFATKPEAKAVRDTYAPGQVAITPGPDHRKYAH